MDYKVFEVGHGRLPEFALLDDTGLTDGQSAVESKPVDRSTSSAAAIALSSSINNVSITSQLTGSSPTCSNVQSELHSKHSALLYGCP